MHRVVHNTRPRIHRSAPVVHSLRGDGRPARPVLGSAAARLGPMDQVFARPTNEPTDAEPYQPGSQDLQRPPKDTKDWTWTVHERCPECGLDAGAVSVEEIADRAEAAAAEWVQILTQNPAADRRPAPLVWSPLEYGAHVRDVFALYDARLVLMLVEDNPGFENWDQDEAAIAGEYQALEPDQVAFEITGLAATLVARIRALEESQLDRRGTRSDGAEFTVRTFLQYFLHDVVHHLWDVTGQQADA